MLRVVIAFKQRSTTNGLDGPSKQCDNGCRNPVREVEANQLPHSATHAAIAAAGLWTLSRFMVGTVFSFFVVAATV